MTENKIKIGPPDANFFPHQSVGEIIYNELLKKDASKSILVDTNTGDEILYEKILETAVNLSINLKRIGVKKGEVITIISENNWQYIIAILSGIFIGSKVNPVNPNYNTDDLKHLLTVIKPNVIFCSEKTVDLVVDLSRQGISDAQILIFDNVVIAKVLSGIGIFKEFWNISEVEVMNFYPTKVDTKEICFILTSTGSSGELKNVQLTHNNARIFLENTRDPNCVDLNETETVLQYLPLYHLYGIILTLSGIMFESKLILTEKFEPETALKQIQDHGVTKICTVPPTLSFLSEAPVEELTSIRDIIYGSSPINQDLKQTVEERLHVMIRQAYGMTETSGAVLMTSKEMKNPKSVGQILPTYEIKICDLEANQPLGPHQVGEICVKGEGIMKGYLEEDKSVFDYDGFFKTGDLGYYDENDLFYFIDRVDNIIKCKGFQVSPVELEMLLIKMPNIEDVAVTGISNETYGEVPLALVVKKTNVDVDAEEIISFIAGKVSDHKQIHGGVKFVDAIPKTASGKIMRYKLKELID